MSEPYIGAIAKLGPESNLASRALVLLCKVLAQGFNITLKFGSNPKTDGKTIWLPHLPYTAKPELVEMVVGNLFHEVAHILYTDFAAFTNAVGQAANPTLFQGIANAIEDPRIEKEFAKVRPYALARIFNGRRFATGLGFTRKPDSPANALLLYVLYVGHGMNGMDVKEGMGEAEIVLRNSIGDTAVDVIAQLLQVGYPKLTSTRDALMLTRSVLSVIEQAANEQQQQTEDDQSESDEKSDDQDESQGQGDSDGKSDDQDESQGQGDSDEKSDDQDESQGQGDSDKQGQEGASSPDSCAQAAQSLLGQVVENPGEAGDDMKAALSQEAQRALKGCGSTVKSDSTEVLTSSIQSRKDEATYEQLKAQAGSASDEVRRNFLVLMTRARSRKLTARSTGRVRPGRFAMSAMGASAFGRRSVSNVRETVVSLLMDCSGSMSGSAAALSAQAAVAVVEACSSVRIPVAVSAFGGESYWNLKGFDQLAVDAAGSVGLLPGLAGGGTPLGEALELSSLELIKRREGRKLMFCCTDGEPNNSPLCRAVIEGLRGQIELVGVGIGGHSCEGLFDDVLTVEKIEDLGPALIEYLQNRVIVIPGQAA